MGAERKLSVKMYDFFNVFSRILMFFYRAQNGPHSVKKCHHLQAFKIKLSLLHKEITFNMTKKTPCTYAYVGCTNSKGKLGTCVGSSETCAPCNVSKQPYQKPV